MSRYHNRVDQNQASIAAALVAIGCTVDYVARRPYDLVVGRDGRTFLLEVKNPKQPPNKRALKPSQIKFSASWRGHWAKVETADEAIAAVMPHSVPTARRDIEEVPFG